MIWLLYICGMLLMLMFLKVIIEHMLLKMCMFNRIICIIFWPIITLWILITRIWFEG